MMMRFARRAVGLCALVPLLVVVSAGSAAASTQKHTRAVSTRSAALGALTERSSAESLRLSSLRAPARASRHDFIADGLTCDSFPTDCGYLFTESQSKAIGLALGAGGVAAAILACQTFGPLSDAACVVIGAAGGSVLESLINGDPSNQCLYLGTEVKLQGC